MARLVEAEIVSPLFTGFSSIRTWVTQSFPLVCLLDQRRVPNGHGDGSWYSTSYKETKALLLCSNPQNEFAHRLEFQHPRPQISGASNHRQCPVPTFKAGGLTEEDVLKLREAKFLTGEIPHRLPAQGQAVPSPQPGESVVFKSHFLRGLGFPMDPFVRGLLFYYGLEFHDLAPESILHISSFIVVCEAFLRVTPHFGLWLKTFGVEPKMIEGRHAECGGAVISKNADAPWPEGSFQEELGLWQ